MITTLIFDFWETLGTKNSSVSKALREKFGIAKDKDFLQLYEKSVQVQQWTSEEEMANNFLLEFKIEQSVENVSFVVNLFRKGIAEATLFDGMRELLNSLKQKGYKLGLLSNTTVFESAVLKNLGIDTIFDALVFSWHKGHLKPSAEAFDQIVNELGVPKDQVVFVDDTEENSIAAGKYGLLALKFTSVSDLRSDLKKLDIL